MIYFAQVTTTAARTPSSSVIIQGVLIALPVQSPCPGNPIEYNVHVGRKATLNKVTQKCWRADIVYVDRYGGRVPYFSKRQILDR